MANNTHNIETGNSSVSLNSELHDEQKSWSRSSSFSLCSNDSFNGSDHRSTFSMVPHPKLPNKPISAVSKRSRNSSGSSESSNMSCISEKDCKKPLLCPSPISQQVINQSVNSSELSNLIGSNHSDFELQRETLLKERLSFPNPSDTTLPLQHNLRRNIRRKKCSCCATTSFTTEIVFRQYKEIGKKTLEKKTVISSTKVKTYVQKNATQEVHKVTYEQQTFLPDSHAGGNRKRKSEIQKLYESLHDMGSQWAKNLSPDNILKPLDIRQAASSSTFGRTSTDKLASPEKRPNKRQKTEEVTVASDVRKSSESTKSDKAKYNLFQNKGCVTTRSAEKKYISVSKNNPKLNCFLDSDSIENVKVESNSIASEQNSVSDVLTLPLSPLEKSGSSSILCASPIKTENSDDCADDPHCFSYNGSLPLISSTLLSKSLCNSNAPRDVFENLPAFSDLPQMFRIAEDGIEGIDGCFHEVAAEVVITTCDLPLLTSIKENHLLAKVAPSEEGPPVLEPCVDVTENKCDILVKNASLDDKPSVEKCALKQPSQVSLQDNTAKIHNARKCVVNISKNSEILKKLRSNIINRFVNKSLLLEASRRVLRKYLKYFQSKSQRKTFSIGNFKHKRKVQTNQQRDTDTLLFDKTPETSISTDYMSAVKEEKSLSLSTTSISMKSCELACQTISGDDITSTTVVKTLGEKVSYTNFGGRVQFDHSKNKTLFYIDKRKPLEHVAKCTHGIEKTNGYSLKNSSFSSPTFASNLVAKESSNESIQRPLLFNFTCHYQTISVSRNNNCTQVALKRTRGDSVFLTLDTMIELKDIVNRTGQDPNTQVLILSGISNSFCLGLDLEPLVGPNKIKASTEIAIAVRDLIEAFSSFKRPLVAVVNGKACGLGVTLLNHADVTIASDHATFCMPYSVLGYIPEGGATLTLPQAVGSTVAMDLILRGQTLTAYEALSIGLINEVIGNDELPLQLASRVKILTKTSISANETAKFMMKMRLHLSLPQVLENEVKLLPRMWLSVSCQESLRNALRNRLIPL